MVELELAQPLAAAIAGRLMGRGHLPCGCADALRAQLQQNKRFRSRGGTARLRLPPGAAAASGGDASDAAEVGPVRGGQEVGRLAGAGGQRRQPPEEDGAATLEVGGGGVPALTVGVAPRTGRLTLHISPVAVAGSAMDPAAFSKQVGREPAIPRKPACQSAVAGAPPLQQLPLLGRRGWNFSSCPPTLEQACWRERQQQQSRPRRSRQAGRLPLAQDNQS